MIILEQGTDVALTVNVLDEAGTPVDVSTANDVYAIVKKGSDVVAKFATTPPVGWETLTLSGTTAVKLLLTHANTATYPVGTYSVSIVTDSTDAEFPAGRRDEYPQTNAFTVIAGAAKTIQS